MSTQAGPRAPLSRERALRTAVTLADQSGIESLTMRRLGRGLGVEAMSLDNHVANKDDILDGIVDLVLGDIEVPPTGTHWKLAMREGGFSIEGALDAWNALDSHLYGFTLQELNLPFEVSETQRVSADVSMASSASWVTRRPPDDHVGRTEGHHHDMMAS